MEEKLKYKIRSTVEMLGLKQSLDLFGKDILKQVYIDNPQSYLDNFKDLTIARNPTLILYMDKRGELVFIVPTQKKGIMDDFIRLTYEIWGFFDDVIDYNMDDSRKIINDWLKINFNLDSPILFIY
jgi:hypothetical protein